MFVPLSTLDGYLVFAHMNDGHAVSLSFNPLSLNI